MKNLEYKYDKFKILNFKDCFGSLFYHISKQKQLFFRFFILNNPSYGKDRMDSFYRIDYSLQKLSHLIFESRMIECKKFHSLFHLRLM